MLQPATALLAGSGTTQQFTALGRVAFTNTSGQHLAPVGPITWSSSDASVVTVDATGKATVTGTGTAIITARSGPFHGSVAVEVTASTLLSIQVTVPLASLPVGVSEQLAALGTFSGSGTPQDITDFVTWSSGDASTISVSSQGVARGLKTNASAITITATASNGVTGTGSITGTPAAIISLAVTPQSASVVASGNAAPPPAASQQQFTAMGTFSDGTVKDVTTDSGPPDSVMWFSGSSDATIVVSGSGAGLATGITIAGGGAANIGAFAPDRVAGTGFISATPAFLRVSSSAGIAYVTSGVANTVTAYNIDYSFGFLEPLVDSQPSPIAASSVPTGKVPLGVAVGGPGGRFVYVVNEQDSTVSMYQVNPNPSPTSPVLIPLSPATVTTDPNPVAIALDSSGSFAYVSCINGLLGTSPGTIDAFVINSNGMLQAVNEVAAEIDPGRLAVPPTASAPGQLLYAPNANSNSISGFSISPPPTGGRLTAIAGSPFAITGNKPISLAADPSGRYLYAGNNHDATVSSYAIVPLLGTSPQTGGNLDIVGSAIAAGDRPTEVAVDPTGQFVYSADTTATGAGNGNVAAFNIQPDGSLAAITGGSQTAGVNPIALAAEPTGQYVYVVNGGNTSPGSNKINEFVINPSSGALSPPGPGRAPFFVAPPAPTDIAIAPPTGKTIASLSLTPANQTVNPGATVAYTVNATYTDGSTQIITSSSPLSASGGTSGGVAFNLNVVDALQPGTYTISTSQGTVNASTSLTVNSQPAISSITVTPPSASVILGATMKFTAIANLTAGGTQDVTSVATWGSDNTTVASVVSLNGNPATDGVASGKSVGTAHITASVGAVTSAQATLTVVPSSPLVAIYVVPANTANPTQTPPAATIPVDGHLGYVAWGVRKDSSAGFIPATWKSSSNSEAMVDTSGLVTGEGITPTGTPVMITGTSTENPSLSASASLNVIAVPHAVYSGNEASIWRYAVPLNVANISETTERNLPEFFAVDKSGQFLYTFNDDGTITVVNFQGGTPTTFPTVTGFVTGNVPVAIAVDPQDRFLYASYGGGPGSGIATYKINFFQGNFLLPASAVVGASAESMAVDPTATYLYAASGGSIDTYTINQADGSLTLTRSLSDSGAGQILLDPAGTEAFVFDGNATAYSVSGGVFTLLKTTTGVGGTDVALDPESPPKFLYTIDISSNTLKGYSVGSTGAATLLQTVSTDALPLRVAVDPSGQAVYVIADIGSLRAGKLDAFQINPGKTPFFTTVSGSPFTDDVNPRCVAVSGP